MFSYRLLASNRAAPDRLDVGFTPQVVIWGAAAEDFEEIETFRNGQCNNFLHVAVRSSCDQDSPVPLHLPFGSDVDLKHTV